MIKPKIVYDLLFLLSGEFIFVSSSAFLGFLIGYVVLLPNIYYEKFLMLLPAFIGMFITTWCKIEHSQYLENYSWKSISDVKSGMVESVFSEQFLIWKLFFFASLFTFFVPLSLIYILEK